MSKKVSLAKQKLFFRIGVVLIATACLLWVSLLFIPLLSLPIGTKVSLSAAVVIAGEVLFWLGVLGTGKEFLDRFKSRSRKKQESPK